MCSRSSSIRKYSCTGAGEREPLRRDADQLRLLLPDLNSPSWDDPRPPLAPLGPSGTPGRCLACGPRLNGTFERFRVNSKRGGGSHRGADHKVRVSAWSARDGPASTQICPLRGLCSTRSLTLRPQRACRPRRTSSRRSTTLPRIWPCRSSTGGSTRAPRHRAPGVSGAPRAP